MKNVFLTDKIYIEDYDCENFERYEFTRAELYPDEYSDFEERKDKKQTFDDWADNNLSSDELLEIPMMNALRYYPDFVDFEEEDRKKVAGSTTLLYDNEKKAWAVGMTGGGMDLSPHLLDTFIELGKGIPFELAEEVRKVYYAYVDKQKHLENCKLLAEAYEDKAKQFIVLSKNLIN